MTKLKTVFEIDENKIKLGLGNFDKEKINIEEYFSVPSKIDFFSSTNAKVFNDQVKKLEELISKVKLKDKRVHIVIPDSVAYNAFLVFPKLKEKELYSAIKFQADQFIPLKLEDASLDIDILEESKDKNKLLVLIIATEKKIIEKVTELFEIVGLIPEVIETQLSALGKLFSYTSVDKIGNSLLINFDYSTTTIYFYEKKRRLIFQTHTFNTGYNLMLKELALSSNIDAEKASLLLNSVGLLDEKGKVIEKILQPVLEDFSSEIKQAVNIAINKHSLDIEGIYLFNLSDLVKGFPAWLKNKVNLSVDYLDISSAVRAKKPLPPDVLRFYLPGIGSFI